MRPPQDGEIGPPEFDRLKFRAHVHPQNDFRLNGGTKVDDGNTQSFGPFAGKRPIPANRLAKISSGTPTLHSLFGVFGGS